MSEMKACHVHPFLRRHRWHGLSDYLRVRAMELAIDRGAWMREMVGSFDFQADFEREMDRVINDDQYRLRYIRRHGYSQYREFVDEYLSRLRSGNTRKEPGGG